VRFDPTAHYTYAGISVGDHCSLGDRGIMLASDSRIIIGNHVIFGPEVAIIAGNHNIAEVGRYIGDVYDKRPGDDEDVVIEDDVWLGARVTVLKGVRIGRGSVVGACSVVMRSLPPYSIATGSPARVLRRRWDVETILRHEEALYSPEARLSREQLRA
jgi:acetyltransferase-like isoleucine patch superfamily enzyme